MSGASALLQANDAGVDDYMHKALWAAAPLDKVMAECLNAWDAYQEEWKAQGYDHPYVTYPYTMDTIKEWFREYEEKVGPVSIETKEDWIRKRYNDGDKRFGAGAGVEDAH